MVRSRPIKRLQCYERLLIILTNLTCVSVSVCVCGPPFFVRSLTLRFFFSFSSHHTGAQSKHSHAHVSHVHQHARHLTVSMRLWAPSVRAVSERSSGWVCDLSVDHVHHQKKKQPSPDPLLCLVIAHACLYVSFSVLFWLTCSAPFQQPYAQLNCLVCVKHQQSANAVRMPPTGVCAVTPCAPPQPEAASVCVLFALISECSVCTGKSHESNPLLVTFCCPRWCFVADRVRIIFFEILILLKKNHKCMTFSRFRLFWVFRNVRTVWADRTVWVTKKNHKKLSDNRTVWVAQNHPRSQNCLTARAFWASKSILGEPEHSVRERSDPVRKIDDTQKCLTADCFDHSKRSHAQKPPPQTSMISAYFSWTLRHVLVGRFSLSQTCLCVRQVLPSDKFGKLSQVWIRKSWATQTILTSGWRLRMSESALQLVEKIN